MSWSHYYYNCSCCGDKVVRSDSPYDVTRNLIFGCCNDVDLKIYSNNDYDDDYNIKCDNCFCLLHIDSWRIKDVKEDKTNYKINDPTMKKLYNNVSLRICCLERVSLAFLYEQKMFKDYRIKVNTCTKELKDIT